MLHNHIYVKENPEDDLLRSKRVALQAVYYYCYNYYILITTKYFYATKPIYIT